MASMKADHRARETPLEQDARLWGVLPWYLEHRKASAFQKRTTRRRMRRQGRALCRTGQWA